MWRSACGRGFNSPHLHQFTIQCSSVTSTKPAKCGLFRLYFTQRRPKKCPHIQVFLGAYAQGGKPDAPNTPEAPPMLNGGTVMLSECIMPSSKKGLGMGALFRYGGMLAALLRQNIVRQSCTEALNQLARRWPRLEPASIVRLSHTLAPTMCLVSAQSLNDQLRRLWCERAVLVFAISPGFWQRMDLPLIITQGTSTKK